VIGVSVDAISDFIEDVCQLGSPGSEREVVGWDIVHCCHGTNFKNGFSCRDNSPSNLKDKLFTGKKGNFPVLSACGKRKDQKGKKKK
jgi:hypothetical protein